MTATSNGAVTERVKQGGHRAKKITKSFLRGLGIPVHEERHKFKTIAKAGGAIAFLGIVVAALKSRND